MTTIPTDPIVPALERLSRGVRGEGRVAAISLVLRRYLEHYAGEQDVDGWNLSDALDVLGDDHAGDDPELAAAIAAVRLLDAAARRRARRLAFGPFTLSPAEDDDDLVRFWQGPLTARWNVTDDEGFRFVTAAPIDTAIEFLQDHIAERALQHADRVFPQRFPQ